MARAARDAGLTTDASDSNALVSDSLYFGRTGEFTVGRGAPAALRQSLLYKLSFYRFWELRTEPGETRILRHTCVYGIL